MKTILFPLLKHKKKVRRVPVDLLSLHVNKQRPPNVTAVGSSIKLGQTSAGRNCDGEVFSDAIACVNKGGRRPRPRYLSCGRNTARQSTPRRASTRFGRSPCPLPAPNCGLVRGHVPGQAESSGSPGGPSKFCAHGRAESFSRGSCLFLST